ncbi:unnamed protein product, partial [Pneumocystis jirovecii]|uniref:Transcription elongation factor S-II n=1 Tax=Pneumocystis jirovecii TaxID=42068 RepID=L0P6Z5_PNEJI
MDIVEVRKVHKDLQKAFQDRNQMKEVIVSESLLIDTKLGITVGKLRNYSEKYVADLAKEIVKKWKEDMSAMKSGKKVSLAENKTDTPITTSELSTPNTFEKTRDSTTDCIEKNITGDKVRDNCVHLIYNALVYGSEESSATILSKAKAIDEYDKNNPTLRQNVVSGELSIPRFCTMTPQEMASKERREEDKKIEEMNLFNAQGAKPIKAITDLFQCGKCKQRKVSYYQMQTRSADEPMTTFCECQVAIDGSFHNIILGCLKIISIQGRVVKKSIIV